MKLSPMEKHIREVQEKKLLDRISEILDKEASEDRDSKSPFRSTLNLWNVTARGAGLDQEENSYKQAWEDASKLDELGIQEVEGKLKNDSGKGDEGGPGGIEAARILFFAFDSVNWPWTDGTATVDSVERDLLRKFEAILIANLGHEIYDEMSRINEALDYKRF